MGSIYKHVFSPISIREIEFKNRITFAPPSPNLASDDGVLPTEFIDWFQMFARGGAATLYVGNCSIDFNESRDEAYQINLGDDKCVYSLAKYADACRRYGCHASLEINHNGENTAYETVGHAPFSSSPNISTTEASRAKRLGREAIPAIEMTHKKIAETVNKYAMAAQRMKRAGMDICMIHGGHGNLISQFTSPLYNHRKDEYGGSLKNRARFAVEVCDAIRHACGENFVIEFRISADEIAENGMHFDETLQLIDILQEHIDIIHLSAGLHSDFNMKYYRNWCQNYMMERGFNVHYARDVKKAFPNLLVNTVGSIVSIEMAEEILSNGWADFVSMCRPLMADPEMPRKYAQNRPLDRRPCLRCDTCTRHLFVPKPIYCAVNPMLSLASELKNGVIPKALQRKKVAVVGGGPAGITAMTALVERGHDVTLYEKTDHFGGNVITAANPIFKRDCQDYLLWLQRQAEECSARKLLCTEATKKLLDAENYDAIIIAVGSEPIIPSISGVEKDNVLLLNEAEAHPERMGQTVIVIGVGLGGIEGSISFGMQGKNVTVLSRRTQEQTDAKWKSVGLNRYNEFCNLMNKNSVEMKCGLAPVKFSDTSVLCRNKDGKIEELKADTFVLATGMRPRHEKVEELRHCAPESDVFIVGDAKSPRTIAEAVNEAFQIAITI